MNSVPEICTEKVLIPRVMTRREIKEKYGLTSKRAADVSRQGFFVKNYSRRQVIIDPIPKRFWKNLKRLIYRFFDFDKVFNWSTRLVRRG